MGIFITGFLAALPIVFFAVLIAAALPKSASVPILTGAYGVTRILFKLTAVALLLLIAYLVVAATFGLPGL